MYRMKKPTIIVLAVMLIFMGGSKTGFTIEEPNLAAYTAMPEFLFQPVRPNVLITLDNSGSMNLNAYGGAGPWQGAPVRNDFIDMINQSYIGWMVTEPFAGEPYNAFQMQVSNREDDAAELVSTTAVSVEDQMLDLGNDELGNPTITAVRFKDVQIPRGAEVTSAWIEFTAQHPAIDQEPLGLVIYGEDINDAKRFENTNGNISSRSKTTTGPASVTWVLAPWTTIGEKHRTPGIEAIVQEIVDRKGWSNGSPMAFIFTKMDSSTKPGRRAAAFDLSPSNAPVLHVEILPAEATKYYGYFNPDYFYKYRNNQFEHEYKKVEYTGGKWKVNFLGGTPAPDLTDAMIVSQELWDGNWLNWLAMRRIDVLRKALIGGKASIRDGSGIQVNYGENNTKYVFIKQFDSTGGAAATPHDGNHYYGVLGDKIYVIDGSSGPPYDQLARVVQGNGLPAVTIGEYNIRVKKDVTYEPYEFYQYDGGNSVIGYNLAGILQRLSHEVRWGLEFFNNGAGGDPGGEITSLVGGDINALVASIQGTPGDTWTPLAESFYSAMQYFKQQAPGGNYNPADVPCAANTDDPYFDGTEFVPCAKSFVILITDGAPTKDLNIPVEYLDYDGDGNEVAVLDCNASDHLDDIALWAHTHDLRGPIYGKTDLSGTQSLTLYTVYAFGDDDDARQLLKDAAKNGGFVDKNGSNTPDLDIEWDEDGDGNPDNFFEALNGHKFLESMYLALVNIIEHAAAGTAASVLATDTEGEGNLIQAYFRPTVLNGLEHALWYGYLQSLWMDDYGNLREDTDGDKALDLAQDKIVKYFTDAVSGDTKVKKFTVNAANPYPDTDVATCLGLGTCVDASIEEVLPIFEAGSILASRNPDERKIFTFIDIDNDQVVDEATEVITFSTGAAAQIKPYLGVANFVEWNYLGDNHDNRTANLINYIRGKDKADLTAPVDTRNRTLNGVTWKLGDIVHSTPASVAKPAENFNTIYKEVSYQYFYDAVKDRETMIYVGGNDGMLHAFTSWKRDHTTGGYIDPYPSDASGDPTFIDGEQIGDEVWAYIPQSLLPHLKWYAHPNYIHSYYVDASPKVFDAQILPNGTHYTDPYGAENWGTFILVGLNMGGKYIRSEGDYGSGVVTRDFYPSYFLMDVTEPRNPKLVWEKTYTDLGMSRSVPAIVKVNNKWYAVFGSGPTDYEGISAQRSYIFVVDLKTGEPFPSGAASTLGKDWLIGPLGVIGDNGFMNTPVTLDHQLNYNVDAIYFGEAYINALDAIPTWKGRVHKITIPCSPCDWDYPPPAEPLYNDNPTSWDRSTLFEGDQPLTTAMALSTDILGNAWIYFGTGRYIGFTDRFDDSQQYLYGIKDPFFNPDRDVSYYHNFGIALTLKRNNHLFSTDNIVVTTSGTVLDGVSLHENIGTWSHLLDTARSADGWYRTLDTSAGPSERSVSKSAVLGGIVFSPTFTPNQAVCGFGGNSNFYAVHFETGTAYTAQVFLIDNPSTVDVGGGTYEEVVDFKLQNAMVGAPPPSVGMHVGRQEGAKAYLQMSTGQVVEMDVDPIFNLESGLINWREQ